MTNLRAGDLIHRVEIQRRETATGSRGQSTESWHTIDRRWARLETLSSQEADKARKLFAETTHRVTMRRPTTYTLDLANRIKFDHVSYGIGSIIESGDVRDDIVLLCSRGQ